MSYRSSILAVFLSTIALIATGVAQTNTTFNVVTSNDSTGPFSGWTPRNLYAVDVNNDGTPDLIQDQYWVSSRGAYTLQPVFGVSIANGDGTFRPAVPYNYPPGGGGGAMAFGDFNGDGKIDIAMPAGHHTIAIYLGRGDGTFVNPWYSVVPMAAGQYIGGPIVAADFNHDGKLDLAVVGIDGTSNTVYILPGADNGLFSSADPVLTVPGLDNVSGEGIQKMLLGNFDGDQNADLAVVATTGNQATGNIATVMVHVLYGNGNFTFDDTVPITSSNFGNVAGTNSGDLNADGKTDLFAIDADSFRLDTFYGRSDRTFASYSQQLPSAPYWSGAEDYFAPAPAMADFNDDGRNDIATITTNNMGLVYLIFLLATPSPGQFTLQTWNVPNATGSFELPQVGDFNHDGKPDWVFNANISPAGSTFYTGLNGTVGLWSNCDYPAAGRGIHVCSPDVSSGSTVNFNAASHSFGSLRKMELWVDGKKLAQQQNTWQGNAWFNFSSTVAPGKHQGDIFAADVDNTLQLAAFSFTVPTSCTAPTSAGVRICAPANVSTTSVPPVLVQATATVTGTLARMEVWVDSTKKYTETDSNSLSASIGMTAGKHTITVFAVNTSGTVWSSATSVSVPSGSKEFLYLTAFGEGGNIHGYQIDTSTGLLAPLAGEPFQANVGTTSTCTQGCSTSVGSDPLGRFLFYSYSQSTTDGVGIMNVNATTGALTNHSVVSLSQPAYAVTSDPSGKYLYGYVEAGGSSPGGLFGYAVGSGGSLTAMPGQPYVSGGPTSVSGPSVTGSYVLAVGQGSTAGYGVDSFTGALTEINGLSAQTYNSAVITPSNTFVYVCVPYQSNDGIKYEIIPYKVTGSGTGVQLAPGTPAQTPATNAFNLVMSPNGNFLYALTDTGVYDYHINQSTGNLTLITGYTSFTFSSMAFDSQMKYVYAATASASFSPLSTNQITAFIVNSSTGELTPISGSTVTLPNAPQTIAVVAAH